MSKVLVFGDSLVDIYMNGMISRISPEAPVPILLNPKSTYKCGGAANVAINLASLNHEVHFVTAIGNDTEGEWLVKQLTDYGVVTYGQFEALETIKKTRFMSQGQQILRVDDEDLCDPVTAKELCLLFRRLIGFMDCVVMSDYGKGTLQYAKELIKICNDYSKFVFVDPKHKKIDTYSGCDVITPNFNEAKHFFGSEFSASDIHKKAEEYSIDNVIVTNADKGADWYTTTSKPKHFDTEPQTVVDVTGAGDCFIAALVHSYLKNYDLERGIQCAVKLATQSVLHSGNYVLNIKDFTKPVTVFTNGCFDVIHAGHVSYLRTAATMGDKLIVGLNSDASVTTLKGKNRPINKEQQRKQVLESLSCVDEVIVFDELTPENLIRQIKPDVLVKGADYQKENVVGAKFVENYGGKVVLIEFEHELSSTMILEKLNE